MKRILLGAVIVIILVLGFRYCENRNEDRARLEESSSLIQEQIKNVGKLVVTEGTFSQVYSFKDSKKFYFDVLSAQKKALIVVNTKVTVAYDLSKMDVEVDEENKTVIIKHIPEEEVNIYPDIKYYDITQDYLNKFDAEDHDKIKQRINADLKKKVAGSTLLSNAQNRLISELQKLYILTSTMGWTLQYNNEEFTSEAELEELKL